MRNRSITIYAHSEEDYIAQVRANDQTYSDRKKIKKKNSKFSNQIESMNNSLSSIDREEEVNPLLDELNMLSYIKKFSIEKRKNSYKEQLLIDEEELKLKLCNQIREKELSGNSVTSNCSDYKLKPSLNKQSSSTCDTSEETPLSISKSSSLENMVIKSILLGDKQTGKTLFRHKFFEESLSGGFGIKSTQPTTALDIKKKNLKIKSKTNNDSVVRVEMVDTNTQIQSSPIIQNNTESIHFTQRQIERVLQVKKSISTSGIIIANSRQSNKFNPNTERLDLLSAKYSLPYETVNLTELAFSEGSYFLSNNSKIQKFIEDCVN